MDRPEQVTCFRCADRRHLFEIPKGSPERYPIDARAVVSRRSDAVAVRQPSIRADTRRSTNSLFGYTDIWIVHQKPLHYVTYGVEGKAAADSPPPGKRLLGRGAQRTH